MCREKNWVIVVRQGGERLLRALCNEHIRERQSRQDLKPDETRFSRYHAHLVKKLGSTFLDCPCSGQLLQRCDRPRM